MKIIITFDYKLGIRNSCKRITTDIVESKEKIT